MQSDYGIKRVFVKPETHSNEKEARSKLNNLNKWSVYSSFRSFKMKKFFI
jgi:hypothetical protein